MTPTRRPGSRSVRFLLAGPALRPLAAALCAVGLSLLIAPAVAAAPARERDQPDLSVGADRFPNDDAVIVRWEQHWSIDHDGAVHRRDHKWLKLLNRRPIRAVADPRIVFNAATDHLVIHAARTHLPDGEILPVPDYSFNSGAPHDVAGWPEYADWQEKIVSFSGIVDNSVLELGYEVVTEPGIMPWISADLRLHEEYPTLDRVVSLTVPQSVRVSSKVSNLGGDTSPKTTHAADGRVTYTWHFTDLDSGRGEPQSPRWEERCGRLVFSTCPDIPTLINAALTPVYAAAAPDDAIAQFAEACVETETDPARQAGLIADKLRASFNAVSSPKTFVSFECRPAAEVFRTNYGNPLETAALLIAACRALDIDVHPELAVDAVAYDRDVALRSPFAAVIAVLETEHGPVFVHPRRGRFTDPGAWGRHVLLAVPRRGGYTERPIHARGEGLGSTLEITGRIELADDASAEADLRLRLTGAFYHPANLESAEAQQKLVNGALTRLLSGFKLTEHAITKLSDDELGATLQAAASAADLPKLDDMHLLTFGHGPVSLHDFPMPLDRPLRRTEVKLAGRFAERVDLTIALPERWEPAILPAPLAEVSGDWGRIVQQVIRDDDGAIHFTREIAITRDRLSPGEFATIRNAVNALRAAASRHLLAGE